MIPKTYDELVLRAKRGDPLIRATMVEDGLRPCTVYDQHRVSAEHGLEIDGYFDLEADGLWTAGVRLKLEADEAGVRYIRLAIQHNPGEDWTDEGRFSSYEAAKSWVYGL